MEFYLPKSAPAGSSYSEGRYLPRPLKQPVDSKIKGLVLSSIGQMFFNSVGALLSSSSTPKGVIDQIALLREELSDFPSKWAGRRRVVGRIAKKHQKSSVKKRDNGSPKQVRLCACAAQEGEIQEAAFSGHPKQSTP